MDRLAALKKVTELGQPGYVAFHSTPSLIGLVHARAAKLDQERIDHDEEPPDRPERVIPVAGVKKGDRMSVVPWQVLHTFARAVALAGQGSARALAQHWDCLRYVTALEAARDGRMQLSIDGDDLSHHRKSGQARELGAAFGLTALQHMLQKRHPAHRFEALDAEIVLTAFCGQNGKKALAGSTATRPNYFLVGREPGGHFSIFAVDTRGTHSKIDALHGQLVSSQQRVHAMVLGDPRGSGGPMPALIAGTQLRRGAGIETRLLAVEGNGSLATPGKSAPDLNGAVTDIALRPWIDWTDEHGRNRSRPGFAIPQERWEWFSRLLARTSAASLLNFAGNREAASRLLTERQRKRLGTTGSSSIPGTQGDARITLGGIPFVGTDQMFRLRGRRVEVFSALHADQYDLLVNGRLDEHEAGVPAVREAWRRGSTAAAKKWDGIVHMDASGSLLAIRVQRQKNQPLT